MLPYLFTIFGFRLPTYGLLVALAFLTALALTARLARRSGLDSETVLNLGIYCAMAGIAGAKLMMILVDFGYYARNPGMLFSLSTLQAAGIFYGGLIVALIVAYFYMRRKQLPMLATADVLERGLPCPGPSPSRGRKRTTWSAYRWACRCIPPSFTKRSPKPSSS